MLSLVERAGVAVAPLAPLAAPGDWRLTGLGKRFDAVTALQHVSLHFDEGELVSVTGPSGAGKSTLGRLLSGLESPSSGDIVVAGRSIAALPARERRVAHMFESFALYPNRTVAQNITSPLEAPGSARRFDAAERARRVADVLALNEMAAYAARLPSQLSGGQKQRVALCRALVQDPSIFVLDEPIGHLDARLRHHLRGEIRRRQRALRPATVWLTPDATEAMAVADRIVVLIGGRVQQLGTPDEVFARPANVAVARLLGDPAMNVLTVPWPAEQGTWSTTFAERFAPFARGGQLQLGLRPTELTLLSPDTTAPPGSEWLDGTVYAVEPLGRQALVTVDVASQRVRVKTADAGCWAVGAPLRLAMPLDRMLSFDAVTGALQT